eukprot:TRINITY_DN67126_c0_g1_i1.p1 TRINITY_DN67126_c0_g1~~TRINITY_DN67126_c0_g1_i1.p1  ORF type:complete len:278 (+),score=55.85 TRINITY_DN67126_c0_g1_i1:64-834(+)
MEAACPPTLARDGHFGAGADAKGRQLSVLSWNVLAPCYVDPVRYFRVSAEALDWSNRLPPLVDELREASADVILLQEVMFSAFAEDLQPLLASLDYASIMQEDKHRGPNHQTGNATFYKEDLFDLVWQEHRSRVLLVALKHRPSGVEVVFANAHLEGDPAKSMERVQQARSALQCASKRPGPHAMLLCGDFNAPLESSAVASFLSFGAVLPGVVEFGREVPQQGGQACEQGHPYSLQTAYAPSTDQFRCSRVLRHA